MATIRKRGNTYQIRVSLGYDMHGEQITKAMTWKPPNEMTPKQAEKEVKRQAALFEDNAKNGLTADSNIRFAAFAASWLEINENNLAPKTYARYQSLLVRINTAMGHIKLSELRPLHLQAFCKNLGERGINKRTGEALSPQTILHHHRLISAILGEAHKQGYTVRDVSKLVTPPKIKKKEVSYLDERDVLKLCDSLLNAPIKWRTALMLLLYVGLRRGELVGLQWRDIDFTGKTIIIRRTVQYVAGKKYEHVDAKGVQRKGRIIEKPPKNESSARSISIDEGEIILLNDYRKWWLEQRLINGDRWIETDMLFVQESGGVMHPDSVTGYCAKFLEKNNLPYFTPHSLRHSNISLMIAQGVDIKTVSTRAGHARVTTTGDIYAHQIKSANAKAAEKIGNILNKSLKNGN